MSGVCNVGRWTVFLLLISTFGLGATAAEPLAASQPSAHSVAARAKKIGTPQIDAELEFASNETHPVASLTDGARPPFIFDEQMVASRQRVTDAISRLNQFLLRGSQQNANQWKDYLRWQDLQQQLEPGVQPDAGMLAQSLANLYSGQPGLELPPFVGLRESLRSYRRLMLYKTDDRTRQTLDEQMATEARDLFDPEIREYGRLASQLSMMDQLGFSPEIVSSARRQYSQPNLYVSASSNFVSRALTEPVMRSEPVNENILGTQIRGTAHLSGHVTAVLLPSIDRAAIQLRLNGVSNTDAVGRQAPVTIFSRGVTQVAARKVVCLDEFGLRADPASANCSTRSQICAIRADDRLGKKLIEKIAWKKARQQQGVAEQESSRRTEQRVARRLDEQTDVRVATTNGRLRDRLRTPLEYRNLFPRMLRFSTTHDRLKVMALQGGAEQLAASSSPPSCPACDLVVQVHETMIVNAAVNLIGGMELSDERAVELMKEATGKVPAEFELKQDEDPWSIAFDLEQPVHVGFENNQMKITVRGRRFTRGDQIVRQSMDIAANYDIQIYDGRIKLVRQGDVDVTYPGKEGRLSLTELRNKTFLANKFEGLFKPELGNEELKFAQNADLEGLQRLREARLTYALAHGGWLTLGWN